MKKKRDILVYLEDILESAELIESYTATISEGEFCQSGEIAMIAHSYRR